MIGYSEKFLLPKKFLLVVKIRAVMIPELELHNFSEIEDSKSNSGSRKNGIITHTGGLCMV